MKESVINKFMQARLSKYDNPTSVGVGFRVTCNDGASFMAYVGQTYHSHPKAVHVDFHYAFEIDDLRHVDEEDKLRVKAYELLPKDIYSNVPFYILDELIEKHGGIKKDPF